MVIMGIDPGLAHTGWAVIETRGGVCRARAYDCITTTPDQPLDVRLGAIFEQVARAIDEYRPQCVSVESIYFGVNVRSAIWTAHARGAALAACAAAGVEVGEYTPMQIKQSVVGTGSADKHQVTYMVRQVLALDHDPKPDHCADALAAAVCHANLSRTMSLGRAGAHEAQLNQPPAGGKAVCP